MFDLKYNDFMNIEHISVSRKQLWDSCQQAYKYKYHLKVPVDTPTQPHFVYGDLVHRIAEEYVLNQGQKSINEIAKETLKCKDLQISVLDKEYFNKLPEHVKHIKNISDRIGYDGEIEWEFKYDLNPPNECLITGFIDRLIIRGDKYFILDYKTTKKGMYRKNKNTIRNDLQLRTYAKVVQEKFGAKAENIKAALFYLEGNEIVSTSFTQEALDEARQQLIDAYDQIKNTHENDAIGNVNQQCKRCDYRSICSWYRVS